MLERLRELGYEPHQASSGPEALAWLERERPAVVLLDLNMPGMSGEEVAARLPQGAPAVVFLTVSSPQEAGRALAQGPHYYLPKAASQEELSLMLQSLAG